MASTKQRQAIAKLRRKTQALNADIQSTSTNLFSQLSLVVPDITFVQVRGSADIFDMMCAFGRDYTAAGDKCFNNGVPTSREKFSEDRSGYEIYYKGQSAGFITLEAQHNIWTNQSNTTIDLVYVRPEFRGLGVAAVAYRWAIIQLGAVGISIAYHRVHGRSAYWRSLGFTKFAYTNSLQKGNKNTLFYLVVPGVNNRLRELSDWNIKAAKEELGKRCSMLMKTGKYEYE